MLNRTFKTIKTAQINDTLSKKVSTYTGLATTLKQFIFMTTSNSNGAQKETVVRLDVYQTKAIL